MNKLPLLAFLLAAASLLHGQTILPAFSFGSGQPNAINDSGYIVGSGFNDTFNEVPVAWDNGVVFELENLGNGSALAVNNTGDAVGWTYDGTVRFPALWVGEIGSLFPDLGFGGQAFDISSDGTVVGFVFDEQYNYRPAKWVDGELELLTLNQGQFTYGIASVINDAGVIAGVVEFGVGRWTGNTLEIIAPVGAFGNITNISNNGTIGGTFVPGFVQPVSISPAGVVTLLPTLTPFVYGQVLGGNSGSLLVGSSFQSENRYRATVWSGNGFDFLPEMQGATYSAATAVNANGLVVGYADTLSARVPLLWQFNSTPVEVTVDSEAGKVGELIEFNAAVIQNGNPVAGERVTFRLANSELGSAVTGADGTARLNARIPLNAAIGTLGLAASVSGGRVGQNEVVVSRGNSSLASNSVSGLPGRVVAVSGVLTNSHSGAPLGSQRVAFMGPMRMFTANTGSNGRAQFGFRIPANAQPGSQIDINLMYSGGPNHNRSMGTVRITVQ